MLLSSIDSPEWEREFELMLSQEHFEDVWNIMQLQLFTLSESFLEDICTQSSYKSRKENYQDYISSVIDSNDKLHTKYHELLSSQSMDDYEYDIDGFKNSILKREIDILNKSLNSKMEVLKDWKRDFKLAKARELYDTFYNMMAFSAEYNTNMTEDNFKNIENIKDNRLFEMGESAVFQRRVIGTGIVSNILNIMYPRVFPNDYKRGLFTLYFLTGSKGTKGINMPSGTSEFLMVKDNVRSKTGIIETENNYFFPYETFALYSLRIQNYLNCLFFKELQLCFPYEYRFLMTNSFYSYVVAEYKDSIQTLTGNDDIYKFTYWDN